jgi:hypothetical protein
MGSRGRCWRTSIRTSFFLPGAMHVPFAHMPHCTCSEKTLVARKILCADVAVQDW